MNATPETREALLDAFAIAQKPDWAWEVYSRAAMGTQMSVLDMFRAVFDAARHEVAKVDAEARDQGWYDGHEHGVRRGRREGHVDVLRHIYGAGTADNLAQAFPAEWAAAVCAETAKDGDGS